MLTLCHKQMKPARGLFTALCLAAALGAGPQARLHAQLAPPNDNLTNAQPIFGATGSATGTNVNATVESGEATPYGSGASIWYLWTAPYTTTIDFNTRNSTDPKTGEELDTVLVAYSLKSGASLAYPNLTGLATNEDDPSGGVTSRVDFPVTVGQVYLIQVLGAPNSGVPAQGHVVLNWRPSMVGGNFGFSSYVYAPGEWDDYIYLDYQPNSVNQSLHNQGGDPNVRVTVTRQGGYTGKCEVTLSLTNWLYTNYFLTNYVITNTYFTNYSTNPFIPANIISWTNVFVTNIASWNLFQEFIDVGQVPELVYQSPFAAFTVTQTNFGTGAAAGGTSVTNIGPLVTNLDPVVVDVNFTNNPCAESFTTTQSTNNPFTASLIEVLCSGTITNNVMPSAKAGVDYQALTTTLTFNDFQMSQDVYLGVYPHFYFGMIYTNGPDWPDTNGNYFYVGINPLVYMQLSNPVLDPSEDQDITPPTLSSTAPSPAIPTNPPPEADIIGSPSNPQNAFLGILNFYGDPENNVSSFNLNTNDPTAGTVYVNLERATFRCNRVPDGSGGGNGTNVYLYAVLSGTPSASSSYTFHYTVDCSADVGGAIGALPIESFDWSRFETVAGSDCAVPGYYTNEGVTFPDFGNPLNTPPDPSLEGVGGRTTWPGGAPYIGQFTIGPFNPGEPYGEIAIPILTNGAVEFDMDMLVQVFETTGDASGNSTQTPPGFMGNITSANVTINFTGVPGGAYDTSWNPDGLSSSYPPFNTQPGALGGAAGSVNAIAIQNNGQAVIGGFFFSYDTHPVYSIARLLTNGFLDTSFNQVQEPGVNYGGTVSAIAIDTRGRILIGGSFSSYDGTNVHNIARLNPNGTLDTTFYSGIGFNRYVTSLAIDASGNILVGGDFTTYNTTNCNHIARLLTNGGLDPAFLPNTGNGLAAYGADQVVETVTLDGNGNIILGGQFSYVNGTNLPYLARLLPSGALDPAFVPDIGPDDTVYSVAIASNNEILIGGAFQNFNLISRPGMALVANNGALDTSFVPGFGADGVVYTVGFQPAISSVTVGSNIVQEVTGSNILVGGRFRSMNMSRRLGLARLLPNGWVDTSFMDTSYNQFAGLINKSYNDPVNVAHALAVQPDGNILVGGSFTNIGGGVARNTVHTQINITRVNGSATVGPQTSGGGIGNCPGNITLTQNPYTVNDTGNSLYITVQRTNGSLGPGQMTLGTNLNAPGPGAASAADFSLNLPGTSTYGDVHDEWNIVPFGTYGWRESDGYYGFNNAIQPISDVENATALYLNVYDDTTALQNLFAGLSEVNVTELGINNSSIFGPLILGGVVIPTYPGLGLPSSTLEIVNNNFPPGEVGFSATNYIALDTSNSVTLTVLRTNGSFGAINVYYCTADGTAESGVNYTGSPSNSPPSPLTMLTFQDGDTSASFTIPIILQSAVRNTTQFQVYLYAPNPGGVLDTNLPPLVPSSTTVTIIDGNFAPGHLSFTSPTYTVDKGGVATVGVMRSGGAVGELAVQCGTINSNSTGTNGINYTGVTNTLTWANQDVSVKTVAIPTLQDNIVEGPRTVNLSLFNATNVAGTNSASAILTSPSNAVLTIEEVDSYGNLNFVAPNFNVMQNAGQALITVIRTNGTTGTVSVSFTTLNDPGATNLGPSYQPAVAGTNYLGTNGLLTFQAGQSSASFVVPIIYTPGESNAANRLVILELTNGSPTAISGQFPVFATLTILDPALVNYPAGSVDPTTLNGSGFNNVVDSLAMQPDGRVLAGGAFTFFNRYPFYGVGRLVSSGAFDSSFQFNQAGANASVLQVLSQTPRSTQTNGAIMIIGDFTQVDQINRGGIARLNLDGSVDESFNPGSGADSTIYAMAETFLPAAVTNQPETLAYYIGGNFANFDGFPCGGITRLNASTNSPGYQGTIDPNFNVGQGVTGSAAAVRALAVQADGKVILGGDFASFNSAPYNHLVRLNVDGSVDTAFMASTNLGPTDSVRAVAIQPDGRILIGGLFTNVGGSNLNYLARLNSADGSVDTSFNVGPGGDNLVLALALDSQGRILVGGEFNQFSGVTRSGITRLNPDGTVDPTINFGTGADGGFVDAIALQANDEINLGGGFATFEGTAENNFVRVFGGANYGNGSVQFMQAFYGVVEGNTNVIITLQRFGGQGTNALTTCSVNFSTSDGTAVAGTNYVAVSTNVIFPYGETFEKVTIPILNTFSLGSNLTVNLTLSNPTNLSIGAQPTAVLILTNDNSAVSFAATQFRQTADAPGGDAIIPVVRLGNPNTTVGVTVYTGGSGTAAPNVVYTPTTNFLVFNPGVMTNYFLIPLLNPANVYSDETVDLEMNNPSNTVIVPPGSATLTVASVFGGPGVLAFSQPSYSVVAPVTGLTNAVITIIRTNGSSNSVSVTFATSNDTAMAGVQYTGVQTNVYFADGVTSQTVSVSVNPQPTAEPATTVYLTLSNPQNGATLGSSPQEILTILNGIESFSFTNAPYAVSESAGSITLQIVRNGPAGGAATVNYSTYTPPGTTEAEGYAQPNVDYVPASNTLNFAANETFTTIPIQIIQGTSVNGPLIFYVVLSSPSPAGIQLGPVGVAGVTINCDITGFEFSSTNYSVGENGSNVVIQVQRLNPATGSATVQYATANGTAVSNIDYLNTSGTLTFANNQPMASFSVPILNPNIVEGNKTFLLALSNPVVTAPIYPYTNAFLLSPSNATVTITNVLAGISFQSPSYSVSECGVTAAIPVVLTGVNNGTASISYYTTNGGSAVANVNYLPTNGTLTFANGQTVQTIYVQVINNHIIGPNHTVYVALSSPSNAELLSPSTAVLTIQECNGAYIVNSGTAFVSGSVSNNYGVILPNETVTVLLGLRDIAGSNTVNLVATLLNTNGVTNASGPQTYGALIANGPTVARAFTFQAVGASGQSISANLALQDGAQVYSNVDFGFTLGGVTTTYSTNETLLLVGSNSPPSKASSTVPPNYGYPSVINVSGLVGIVTGVTAGISNFGHTYPSDVAMVLAGPSVPSQGVVLMDDCGGSNVAQNLNLAFSQNAASFLPLTAALSSGTYKPTQYGVVDLPATTPSQIEAAPTSFTTNLTTFVGQAPNGAWALFVADEAQLDRGYVSNGWSLIVSTGIPVQSDSDLEMTMTCTPSSATANNILTYNVTVTNYGPATATNVTVANTLPSGVSYVGSSGANCTVVTNGLTNGVLTFTNAMLAVSNGLAYSIQVIPTNLGYITNIAVATANQPDPNVNYAQTNVALVTVPSADLAVSLGDSPNPVLDGGNVTYTIVVTNNGPSTATGVVATNVLPGGFLLVTNQTVLTQGSITNVNGTIYWTVGAMADGASDTLTIVTLVNLPETNLPSSANLDSVTVGSQVYDPFKANNYASVKTEVEPAVISVAPSASGYLLSWPATAGNIVLEGSVALPPVWVPITNTSSVVPQVVGGQLFNTYVLPSTNNYHFFRLVSRFSD